MLPPHQPRVFARLARWQLLLLLLLLLLLPLFLFLLLLGP